MNKYARELSQGYRQGKPHLRKEEHYQAYLTTRFPATFGVVKRVLQDLTFLDPKSFCDIGAGPGTAYLAAKDFFALEKATLLEGDRRWIAYMKENFLDPGVSLKYVDLKKEFSIEPHDLAVMSYSLGEIPEEHRPLLLKKIWDASHTLVIIEPGTPQGFMRIKNIREMLLSWGGNIIAPCPHLGACLNDWCHFAERISRTRAHRIAKEGSLGYEDEKFSYVVFSKTPKPLPQARIIRHPFKEKGCITVNLCTPNGITNKRITKENKEKFRIARKLQWGEIIRFDV